MRGSISPASNVFASPNSIAGLLPGCGYLPATLQQHKDNPNLQPVSTISPARTDGPGT